ncbi:MAG: NADH-quinone oxidoreductase subunit L [Anaerolineales bacterium]
MLLTLIALIIGVLWGGAFLVLALRSDAHKHMAAVGTAVLAGLLSLGLLPLAQADPVSLFTLGAAFGDVSFVADGLGATLAVLAAVIGSLTVIFSVNYMQGEADLGRYYALMLFFIGAMVGLALSDSLLLLFFFWEVTALCSYALIAFDNDNPKAVAGGVRALVITSLGGVGLFLGALIIRAETGSYAISDLLANPNALPADMLALVAFGFLAAAAAKSAQVPFQTWLPGAMEAPTPISALIHAATMVNAGVYLLMRFFPAFEGVAGWTEAVIAVGLASALLAASLAILATDLKAVLAYSTISQLGYMVVAVGIGGVFAAQFHLFSHAIFKALLFLGAGAIIHSVGTRDMRQMGGLWKEMPFVRNVFLIGALALMGIPFFNGFWSKEFILETAKYNHEMVAFGGMLLGALMTGLYTMRMLWLVFLAEPAEDRHPHPAGGAMRFALGVLAVGAVTSWLLVGPLSGFLHDTLPHHHIETLSVGELVSDVMSAPATYGTLAVIALGISLWFVAPKAQISVGDFGFSWLNSNIVAGTQRLSAVLSITQTGQLNWNLVGIAGALAVVLLVIIFGGAS